MEPNQIEVEKIKYSILNEDEKKLLEVIRRVEIECFREIENRTEIAEY